MTWTCMAKKRTVKRRKKTQAKSIGLSPAEAKGVDAQAVSELARGVPQGPAAHSAP